MLKLSAQVNPMQIKPIKTEQDYEDALRAVEPMFDDEPPADTPEGDFSKSCVLINEYENKHFPIEAPDPIEAIKFRMEQQGLTVKILSRQLENLTGSMKCLTANVI